MYDTLYNVFPTEIDQKEISKRIAQTSEYFSEKGRYHFTKDEFAFVMTLDRYIEIFEKAKSMITNDKFTVEFKGTKDKDTLNIEDFQIIAPAVKKVG